MLELLAPGGSWEGMTAAVNAGADAVYMGGQRFGARAYAQNPDETALLRAMDYCHLRGRKLYLTVNTLLKERELERDLYDYLEPLYEHGLDAVLVQDYGVFQFIRRNFPGLPLHASTQMTITGADGAGLLKRMGAERIVPSRELSLEEIRRIHQQVDIEIECFVHGALCYCYSGQCLMSSLIGGRSGNRGRCAQPCRLPYDLYQGRKRQNSPEERYLLSLKDICTLETLPDLIDAGVCSFKIEGRMKRPEYAAGVTEIYRKQIDIFLQNGRKGYRVDPEDERILMDLYNRGGFSKGYYQVYNSRDMMAMKRPNHWGTPAAKVIGTQKSGLRLEAQEDLLPGDALELKDKKELILRSPVKKGERFTVSANPAATGSGRILARVRCEKLLEDLRQRYMCGEYKEKIKGKFILKRENPAILTVKCRNWKITVTGMTPEEAASRPLEKDTILRQLSKTGNTPFFFDALDIQMEEGLFYPMQNLNEIRRRALELLEQEILETYRRSPAGKTAQDAAGTPVFAPVCVTEGDPREETDVSGPRLRASVESFEQLDHLLGTEGLEGVYLDSFLFLQPGGRERFVRELDRLHANGKKGMLMLPPVWRDRTVRAFEQVFVPELLEQADGFLLRSGDELEYMRRFAGKKEMIADSGIYTYNKEARAFLRQQGITMDTAPVELNRGELQERGCQGSEIIIYGYLPLMVTAQCLTRNTSGCKKTTGIRMLRDRKNAEFPVRNQCSCCTNIIYNSLPLDLTVCGGDVLSLKPASCRLTFTFERGDEAGRIAEAAGYWLCGEGTGEKLALQGTRGHFKRGVE